MKIFYIGVIRNSSNKGLELASATEMSSFNYFQRTSVAQFMSFFADTVAMRTNPGQRQSVEDGDEDGNRKDGSSK